MPWPMPLIIKISYIIKTSLPMKKMFLLSALSILNFNLINAQISFSNQTSNLLSDTTIYSGCSMGIADMNGDTLDDIIRLNDGRDLYIDYQKTDGSTFDDYAYGNTSSSIQWSMCIADVDSNGFNDILVGGYFNQLNLLKANAVGDDYIYTEILDDALFLQGSNFADIDNNGTIDLFACHDIGLSKSFSNDGNGNLTYDLSLINPVSTIPSDNSGNYGTLWTDYDSDGDLDMYLSKCRGGVTDPLDGRRVNQLFQNDGNGNYTDVAEAAGLRPLGQSWATDFADIDNDGDLDCFILNHDISSGIYENAGDGTFTNVTSSSGISSDIASIDGGIQCMFKDFDNDSYVDLLVTTSNGHKLFRNNGDFTFSLISDAFPTSLNIQSAVVGDLNNDGALDVYAGFSSYLNSPSSDRPDKVYINDESTNNYLRVLLKGDNNNINAIGSRIEIYGSWGVQVREVRSGESYGIMNSFISHFGLGGATTVDSLIVRWPVGQVDKLYDVDINQTLFIEDTCIDYLLVQNLVIDVDTTFKAILQIQLDNVDILHLTKVKFEAPEILISNNCEISNQNDVTIINKKGCINY